MYFVIVVCLIWFFFNMCICVCAILQEPHALGLLGFILETGSFTGLELAK